MRQRFTTLLLVLLLPAFASAEELRVLMSFGADGHKVENVFKVENSPVAAQITTQRLGLQARSVGNAKSTGVLLQWLDGAGNILAEEVILDPRITHAPARKEPIPDKLLKSAGVYLLNGPVNSRQLRLNFPLINLSTQLIPASILLLPLNQG